MVSQVRNSGCSFDYPQLHVPAQAGTLKWKEQYLLFIRLVRIKPDVLNI